MLTNAFRCALVLTLVFAGSLPMAASAEDDAEGIDPKAKKIVEQAGAYMKGLKSFALTAETAMKIDSPMAKMTIETPQTIRVERPNKLALITEPGQSFGQMSMTIVSDGSKLYLSALDKYSEEEAPESLTELESNPLILGGGGQASIVLGALLSDDPAAKLLQGVESAKYVGEEGIDGTKCHHLKFEQEAIDFDLWVAEGDKPLVRRFVPDMAKVLANTAKQLAGQDDGDELAKMFADMKMDVAVDLVDWKTDPKFTSADFAFTPPDGAEKVDSLLGALGGAMAGGGEEAAHALLGKDAPNFKLGLYEGGNVDLAAHKGKNVVILDFWASWCGPCRQAMPTIAKVAKEYEKKGVVFYAVNLDEDAETIGGALEEDKLDLTVAMDTGGEVANLYGVEAIPQTVLIGKDGTVQVVHVGASPDLESRLRKELDALVAGKKLTQRLVEEAAPVLKE